MTKKDITLADIDQAITKLGTRFGTRFGGVESRLGNVESRLGNVESRLGNVESRLGNVESRLGNIEEKQKEQGGLLEDMNHKFDKNIDLLTKQMNVKKKVDDHEERITDLETGYKTVKSVVTLHSEQLGVK